MRQTQLLDNEKLSFPYQKWQAAYGGSRKGRFVGVWIKVFFSLQLQYLPDRRTITFLDLSQMKLHLIVRKIPRPNRTSFSADLKVYGEKE